MAAFKGSEFTPEVRVWAHGDGDEKPLEVRREPGETLGTCVQSWKGFLGLGGRAEAERGSSVLTGGQIRTWVEERGVRTLLKSPWQECARCVGDKDPCLASTEDLWIGEAVTKRTSWALGS